MSGPAQRLETIETTAGGRAVRAFVARPASLPAPGVVIYHAFKGLTDEFKALAVAYADQGYLAVAADLMDGKTSNGFLGAMLRMMFLDKTRVEQAAVAWVNWLRSNPSCTGKVGTIGWCFGGRWSLNASIATPVDATVVYYGSVERGEADLAKLKGPVLGHFGRLDRIVKPASVETFAQRMKALGRPLDLHWYEANHAFANPGGAWYDAACAQAADTRTATFLAQSLK
jgi:carboxymethylenebutenolidase